MGVKISELVEKTTANSSDVIPVVDTGTKKMKLSTLLNLVFPICSTYVTQTNTNPSTILGFGTWERVKGKVLVGLDEDDTDFNTIGKIGGEKEHTLTVDEMPSHLHGEQTISEYGYTYPLVSDNGEGDSKNGLSPSISSSEVTKKQVLTDSAGGDQPHNNLQPYQVVGYMWKRTA